MSALLRSVVPLLASFVFLAAGPAYADPESPAQADPEAPAEAHFGGQRNFGFGPTIGFTSGVGGLVGGGGELVKAWVSGGYMPVLIFANDHETKAFRYNGYSSAQINGDVTVRLAHRERFDVSLLVGYKFNTVIGQGGGGGLLVQYDLSHHLAFVGTVGAAIFPSAKDRLVDHHDYPTDRDPSLPWLQSGLNAALVIFP